MIDEPLAALSNTLFNVAFVTYIVAMVLYFFRFAFTQVSVSGVPTSTRAGDLVGRAATSLTVVGVAVHLTSYVTRGMAANRVPWANMYEYSSGLALLAVIVGLVVVQRRLGYGHLMGFVLAASVLMMTSALLLFTEAGPVVPALNSYWIRIHTSAAMASSSVFMVAFAATSLYLVKDTAERRVAARAQPEAVGTFGPSSAGAAAAPTPPDSPRDVLMAQREAMSPVAFPVVPGVVVAGFVVLVWRAPMATLIAGSVAALIGIATWYAIPYLPSSERLDSLAYRTIAFGFPIWTFAVLAGAIWAEEAWGRYWGWDPKETGSFFTWLLYAAYLHARSTRGWRGRPAAWIGVVAFVALMVTYYAVNLFIVGLHSYAGV